MERILVECGCPDEDLARGRQGDNRWEQALAVGRGHNPWLAVFQRGDQGVCGPQIDPNDPAHGPLPPVSFVDILSDGVPPP
jgi:hypothetical protein